MYVYFGALGCRRLAHGTTVTESHSRAGGVIRVKGEGVHRHKGGEVVFVWHEEIPQKKGMGLWQVRLLPDQFARHAYIQKTETPKRRTARGSSRNVSSEATTAVSRTNTFYS